MGCAAARRRWSPGSLGWLSDFHSSVSPLLARLQNEHLAGRERNDGLELAAGEQVDVATRRQGNAAGDRSVIEEVKKGWSVGCGSHRHLDARRRGRSSL